VSAAPFVVEPVVRLEKADVTKPSRRVQGVQAARGTPVRLEVPGLRVDVPVTGISAPDGVLLPPSDPQVLGWWRDGALPGAARGSALITGHTVSTGGGAFDDLETLGRGDRVRVRTTRGILVYEVTGVTIYRKATLAEDAARVFSQSVPGRLVLITCEDWNGSTYLSNAVVFAEPLA
jgi:LPXTG-site transpeptidase (sortase) family protein